MVEKAAHYCLLIAMVMLRPAGHALAADAAIVAEREVKGCSSEYPFAAQSDVRLRGWVDCAIRFVKVLVPNGFEVEKSEFVHFLSPDVPKAAYAAAFGKVLVMLNRTAARQLV